MKRTALEKQLRKRAEAMGLEMVFVREGGAHTIWRIGSYQFSIPRHKDINEITARAILDGAKEAK
jgi:mRNA interferase HicA